MDSGERRWVPDKEVTRCFLCARGFDLTTRKHHCRYCGRVACAACTPSKALIPLNDVVYPPQDASISLADFDPREAQRVCRECEHVLTPMQAELQETMTHAAMPTAHNRSSVERYLNSPLTFDLTGEIVKAANILLNFTGDNAIEGADSVPRDLILEAQGLAFITFVKVGLFVTARVGTGLVIARKRDRSWSAPTAIGSAGVGWGFQIGGELTDMMIVLNTVGAVEAFAGKAQVSLGTELSLSVGPVGRTASTDIRAGDGGVTAAFSYAHSKGVFIGVSVEAGTLVNRPEANREFYGRSVSPQELLLGDMPQPKAAEPLYNAIAEVECNNGVFRGGPRGRRPPPGRFGPQPQPQPPYTGNYPGGSPNVSHFAPFRPDAEDHLRTFTVSDEERRQMQEDYNLALAMQKGEAAASGAGSVDASPGAGSMSYPAGVSNDSSDGTGSVLSRFGGIFDGGNKKNGHAQWGRGSRNSKGGNETEDAWELERSTRIEQARREQGGLEDGSELGEMGSFLSSSRPVRSNADSITGSDDKNRSALDDGLLEGDEEDEDSSDDDEYRRDIAEFSARKKGV